MEKILRNRNGYFKHLLGLGYRNKDAMLKA